MSVFFENKTKLPIVVETWVKISEGLSRLIDICVLPEETKEIESLTGEWKIHRMFSENDQNQLWNDHIQVLDKKIPLYLAKFRNIEAYNGECIWMDTELFSLTKKDNLFIWVSI
jgi:hypothetical protein